MKARKGNWRTSPWTWEAQRLRARMTPETRRLWSRLRRRQLDGYRFRREHSIGPYYVDFFCHSAKLAIEVEGEIHEFTQNIEHDRQRAVYLNSIGVMLIRFHNWEIRFYLESVLARIHTVLTS